MGVDFRRDPKVQLMEAVKAVFRSWDNPRAIYYRRMNDIPGDWGALPSTCSPWSSATWAKTSGTGVAFTRNPSTGEKKLYGEYLLNAQGEDVVAGIRTPEPISHLQGADARCVPAVCGHRHQAGSALSRHAGHGIHH